MAERRMFAKTIIDSDAFLDMPLSTQALYFHLSMRADDDGFINKPKTIMRMTGCKDDDIRLLVSKKFVIPFETGVVVIKHWKIHNYIRKDSYSETKYKDEKALLSLDENSAYTITQPQITQTCDDPVTDSLQTSDDPVEGMATQDRIGKDRLGKDSIFVGAKAPTPTPKKRFVKPTVDQIMAYCAERGNHIDSQRFYDYYEANGWKVGKNPMKDWKAAVRNWERREEGKPARSGGASGSFADVAGDW